MRASLRFQALLLSLPLLAMFLPALYWLDRYEHHLLESQRRAINQTALQLASPVNAIAAATDLPDYSSDRSDLYAYRLDNIIAVDGRDGDWSSLVHHARRFGTHNTLEVNQPYDEASIHFYLVAAKNPGDLYLLLQVVDDAVVYREAGSLSIHRNDHIQIAFIDPSNNYRRFTIAPTQPGPASAYLVTSVNQGSRAVREERLIEANWLATAAGYNVEIRIPIEILSRRLSITVTDVDDANTREPAVTLGTASTAHAEDVGNIYLTPPQMDDDLATLAAKASRLRLVDRRRRLIAEAGNIQTAHGIWTTEQGNSWLPAIIARSIDWQARDPLADPSHVTGEHIGRALDGQSMSIERGATSGAARILSVAQPVIVDGKVVGALVVEQTTHGLLALRNALAGDMVRNVIVVFATGLFLLIIFASLVSTRINRLTRQLSQIAGTGNAAGALSTADGMRDGRLPVRLADEITDLAHQFTGVTLRLRQNNQYLENLSKRLAHELRTPIAVVRSSLDNLEMAGNTERHVYIARAREGIERLSTILNNMTEASRLEESLDPAETEYFDLTEVVRGCVDGYRIAYPGQVFDLSIEGEFEKLSGLPDLVAQMLDKLVSNAVSFATRATPIKIRLTRERDAVIRVINTGPQLPDIASDSLFDSMTSVRSMPQDAETRTSSSHLGLGLYIAKLIAEFHGGRISVHNREDTTGVVVTVYLPFMRITGRA